MNKGEQDDAPGHLTRRIRMLEARIEELQHQLRAARKREALYSAYLKQLAHDVESVLASARWKVGNAVIGFVERLLGRGRPALVIHHMRDSLRRFDQRLALESSTGGSDFLEYVKAGKSSALAGAAPLRSLIGPSRPIDETLFAAWLERHLPENPALGSARQRLDQLSGDIDVLLDNASCVQPPLVSIVMPCFNREGVVAEAIQSVLEQSYADWELIICDDGSTDGSVETIRRFDDDRIRLITGNHAGAAAARNSALAKATGDIIAYLDSDNVWHPDYLAAMVGSLLCDRGRWAAYCDYFDLEIGSTRSRERNTRARAFDYEALTERNFIDLNGFIHWRELYDRMGGFTESLPRQQDWDLILKYTFLRDPIFVDIKLYGYRRDNRLGQLTELKESTREETETTIEKNLARYYRQGLPFAAPDPRPVVTVLVWDICRNHFSKAYNVAEALSRDYDVQLLGFRFFENEIFPPYGSAEPDFETLYLAGMEFPAFGEQMASALSRIRGDVIYCVKPRLPSLGVALLANYHFGKPVIIETNDLESAVTAPDRSEALTTVQLDLDDPDLLNPYSDQWTGYLESLLPELPYKVTHNENLNRAVGGHCWFVRNPKDEEHFDPGRHDRSEARRNLRLREDQKAILFAGLARRHKGIFELAHLSRQMEEDVRLLVIGSRGTPDLRRLEEEADGNVTIIPPCDRNEIASLTAAADAVVLWLDPATPASHFQMPFKLTDALAMKVPVVANEISDLEGLIRAGFVQHVEFGDLEGLKAALTRLWRDEALRTVQTEKGRRLYLRQFGYRAVRASIGLMLGRIGNERTTHPAAAKFARTLAEFRQRVENA